MRTIKRIILALLALSLIWLIFEKDIKQSYIYDVYDKAKENYLEWRKNPEIDTALNKISSEVHAIFDELDQLFSGIKKEEPIPEVKKPTLDEPVEQTFSINNIELNNSREDVEKTVGAPKRTSYNEYGVEWSAFHENYHNFFMVAYDKKNKVVGLYTNQDLISSIYGIKNGSPKEFVLEKLGKPLEGIRKGFVSYQIQNNGEYDLFLVDESYITVFYDKHENNTVTAIQIISKDLENQKDQFYTAESPALEEGFEYQLFDLTNAARVEHGLSPLIWNDHVKVTARKHSLDMAVNNYFNHTNLKGQSPFDRMKEDQITFIAAGENLAAGQLSSVFAHEGLMNSLGHRQNILQSDFEELGVGVAFDTESKPYYTENFIAQ